MLQRATVTLRAARAFSTHTPPHGSVTGAALRSLEAKRRVVASLRPGEYSKVSKTVGASIGQHLRHSLDHFDRCVGAIEHGQAEIRYDVRGRGTPIETDPAQAIALIDALQGQIKDVRELKKPCRPSFFLSAAGDEFQFASNLERELWFCVHHGIHHDAMIAIILRELGHKPADALGLAPSTANYEIVNREEKAA